MEGVTWLKWLPRAEILQRMKDASVLILPSTWYEGFPMILAEAFAVGLPVIASNLGSMSSVVDHLRTGLHFEPGNASDLVEAVRWLRAHPAEAALMRAQARMEYETKYTGGRELRADDAHLRVGAVPEAFPAAGQPDLALRGPGIRLLKHVPPAAQLRMIGRLFLREKPPIAFEPLPEYETAMEAFTGLSWRRCLPCSVPTQRPPCPAPARS